MKEELKAAPGGGELDPSELDRRARGIALERGRQTARDEVINKKGKLC